MSVLENYISKQVRKQLLKEQDEINPKISEFIKQNKLEQLPGKPDRIFIKVFIVYSKNGNNLSTVGIYGNEQDTKKVLQSLKMNNQLDTNIEYLIEKGKASIRMDYDNKEIEINKH